MKSSMKARVFPTHQTFYFVMQISRYQGGQIQTQSLMQSKKLTSLSSKNEILIHCILAHLISTFDTTKEEMLSVNLKVCEAMSALSFFGLIRNSAPSGFSLFSFGLRIKSKSVKIIYLKFYILNIIDRYTAHD